MSDNFDPDLLTGWGVRASDWSLGVSVQQQILPRMSIEVAYHRRWFNGFTLNDNLLTKSSDYTAYSITAPQDPRLPDGGGYVISGLYDVSPALSGQINNLVTDSGSYGDWYQYFNGVDITLNVRTRSGVTFQGGTSTGQNVADNCAVRASLPELSVGIGGGLVGFHGQHDESLLSCRLRHPDPAPGAGLVHDSEDRSADQRRLPKQARRACSRRTTPCPPPSWRSRSDGCRRGMSTNVTINLVKPGSMYGNRLNQLDFRVAKLLRFGRSRTTVGVDLYNVLNSSAILTYSNLFVPGGLWLQPTTVLTGRFARISAQFDF